MFEKKASQILDSLEKDKRAAQTLRDFKPGTSQIPRLHKSGESGMPTAQTARKATPGHHVSSRFGEQIQHYSTRYGVDHLGMDTARY